MFNWVRSVPRLRQLLRNCKMAFVRRLYGLRHVDKTFYLVMPCKVSRDFVAGAYSFVNCHAEIGPGVSLGRYVLIAPYVSFVGADHVFDRAGTPIIFSGRPPGVRTVVEDDVWIGYRAIVKLGVRIGRGAIVAAGAVVTQDVTPYTIVAGVPAREVKKRFADDEMEARHNLTLSGETVTGEYCLPKAGNDHCVP